MTIFKVCVFFKERVNFFLSNKRKSSQSKKTGLQLLYKIELIVAAKVIEGTKISSSFGFKSLTANCKAAVQFMTPRL